MRPSRRIRASRARPVLEGRVDSPEPASSVHRAHVVVRGWHVWDGRPVAAVAVEARGARTVVVPAESRPDVAESMGDPRLADCGWCAVLDLGESPTGRDEITQVTVTVWPAPDLAGIRIEPITVTLSDTPPPRPAEMPAILGNLDQPEPDACLGPVVDVSGWAVGLDRAVDRVEILVDGETCGSARLGIPRKDVAESFQVPWAVLAGFEDVLDLSARPPGPVDIVVRGWAGDDGPVDVASGRFELVPAGGQPDVSDRAHGPRSDRRAALAARRGRLHHNAPSTGGELDLAVVTHSLEIGGAERWLGEMLRRTRAGRDFPCRVLSLGDGPLLDDLEARGIEVEVIPLRPPADIESYEGSMTAVAAWLASAAPNMLLVNTVLPWFATAAAADLGIPVAWVIHESWSPDELWATHLTEATVPPEVRATLVDALRRATALLFVSAAARRVYLPWVDASRTGVLPPAIPVDGIDAYCRRVDREAARAQLGVDPGQTLVLSVGRLQPLKGQTLLAMAFAEVAEAHPDACLAIVGVEDGFYAGGLAEFLEHSDLEERVRLVPLTDDTYVWYRAADAFVSTSDTESLPLTIMEALAMGLPVAATSVFGVPDLLTHGETAYLFEPRDKAAAAGALRRLLAEDRTEVDRMAAAGQRLAAESLDASVAAEALTRLLRGIHADPTARAAELLGGAETHLPTPQTVE